jgi:dolichol-phosphate mannosyltransferase
VTLNFVDPTNTSLLDRRPRSRSAEMSIDNSVDLTLVIPAVNEQEHLEQLLSDVRSVLESLEVSFEMLIIARRASRSTRDAGRRTGAVIVEPDGPGYGRALSTGIAHARGTYVLTMAADLSHPAAFIPSLWTNRHRADILVASRYVDGGHAGHGRLHYLLSRALNTFFARGLDLPISDLSSSFRLYRRRALIDQHMPATGLDILQQILVQAFAAGWRVFEVPFASQRRVRGRSHAPVPSLGLAFMRTFGQLWRLRNSILAADYDDRAHDSRIFLQRYWQRARFRHVTELIDGHGPVLDVGCGSSRIIASLPAGSVAVDVLLRKLRYARRFGKALAQASGFALPFADNAFPCVLCSQVIEHVPKDSPILNELCRVLRPGGRLVLGTPDYANWQWVWIERLYAMVPGGYADEHIAHYTRAELIQTMAARGFRCDAERYILQGELILAFTKVPARPSAVDC